MAEYYGHKTMLDGTHVPLTKDEATAIMEAVETAKQLRAQEMPTARVMAFPYIPHLPRRWMVQQWKTGSTVSASTSMVSCPYSTLVVRMFGRFRKSVPLTPLQLRIDRFSNEGGHAVWSGNRFDALPLLIGEPDFRFFDVQWWSPHTSANIRPLKVCQSHRISVPAY